MPEKSFNTSMIYLIDDGFFPSFNENGKLLTLPKNSFSLDSLSSVGNLFFSSFNKR
ncbi:hypothetical protein IJM86_01865 [bacterium]|nr:hypothetical protein [bacterium]